MDENIRIDYETRTVYLSEEMLSEIKKLIKGDSLNGITKEKFDSLSTDGIDYNDFKSIIYSIESHFEIITKHHLKEEQSASYFKLDEELYNQVKDLCKQYFELKPDRHIRKIFSYKHRNSINLEPLEQIINLSSQIKETEHKMYLLRDLIDAKEDCITDMKYFMNEEEINRFELDYSKYINEKNIDKMVELLKNVQKLILKEWKNYFANIEDMTDENFSFIGHSTRTGPFNGDFYSRYISCSLFNQDINDTFNCRFGFIMEPTNIVGADSSDMYANNYAQDEETLLNYSAIPKIHHPQRLIDECKTIKQENIVQNKNNKVYNEVIIDGFAPIGLFCFTNGAKEYDWQYKEAMKLKKEFPNLEIKTFDIMKTKTGEKLKKMQLVLINTLNSQIANIDYHIEIKDLPRYEMFLKNFANLKKLDSYTEKDIETLFKHNLSLLSIFDTDPNDLFNGKYNDEEIKFILGNNVNYNIDYILNGDITLYSLQRLNSLKKYKDKLNKYYDGLSDFVDLITKVELTKKDLEEIKKEIPTNFYKMSKYLLKNLSNNLEERQNKAKSELTTLKTKYKNIIKEQKVRREIENKKDMYFKISTNKVWLNFLNQEFDSLNKEIKENTEEAKLLKEEKIKIENEIKNLENANQKDLSADKPNSPEDIENQNKINNLKKELQELNKHPILNNRKIRKITKDINELERKQQLNNNIYLDNIKNNIDNRNYEIEILKIKLKTIESHLKYNNDRNEYLQKELSNLNKEVYKKFNCDSISKAKTIIKEADEFLDNYDYSNIIILDNIERELEEIQNKILSQEDKIQSIEEERKGLSH